MHSRILPVVVLGLAAGCAPLGMSEGYKLAVADYEAEVAVLREIEAELAAKQLTLDLQNPERIALTNDHRAQLQRVLAAGKRMDRFTRGR
jgi:hypothetical protein